MANQRRNQLVVNTKSSFKAHLVKCQDILDDINFDELILVAIGRANQRAARLAQQININNFGAFQIIHNQFQQDVISDNIKRPLLGSDKDKFDPDDKNFTATHVEKVPAVKIIVKKNPLETKKYKNIT